MRRFTLITIIVLLALIATAAVFQTIVFLARDDVPRPGVTPPTPTQT